MVSVNINTGEFPSAVGKDGRELSSVIGKWQSIAFLQFREDCKSLISMIDETDQLRLWEKNIDGFTYGSRDEFLKEMVLIDYDFTEQSFSEIVSRLRRGDQVSLTLRAHGGDRRSEQARDQVGNTKLVSAGGMTAAYTIARLNRDNPELAQKVKAGEMSANAAAVKAGFRKPPPSSFELLKIAWSKCTDSERSDFLDWIKKERAA